MENIKLYATRSGQNLGEAIAIHLSLPLNLTQAEKFSDGELFVKFNESVRGKVVLLIGKIHTPYENFFELLMTIDAARRSSAKEVILIIPYLPHSRQERRDGQRTSISSRMIADMIQLMGADRLITLDLHTNAIEGFYKIPVDPLSSLKLFISHIQQSQIDHLCLCSPDFGGIKRIKQYKKNLAADMVVINKERLKPNAVTAMEIIGDVVGKNVVIVDDLVDTAGTLCKAADLLIEHGALSVKAYCTHGVLSGDALENLTRSKIEKLLISDTVQEHVLHPKIEVVSCAGVLASAIENIISNRSLSNL
ncbi:MAG TPA: ribose-phosphate diphosphokinase [Cyclobacteriaceae bacterium]|jgi:ribose-phosphate pyrophosphokinase|nr:ribose-phosphate diphosphokinase [Cytophagales bacterium]HRE67886.1 ribose-phosphate diphosphokinase [Cyclobacteriaceae bacterium]HRF32078.1 ribose-phosphate diphosphokinase [Cyclobacteriaceae bacterium]